MKKKIIALCLIVALAITAVTGATLAYFTDTASDVNNTFTIGNIDIELTETVGVKDQDGNDLDLVEENDDGGYDYTKLMPGYQLAKEAVVENTGDNTAYVRVFVTINNHQARNEAIDDVYEELGGHVLTQEKYTEIYNGWGINHIAEKDHITGYTNGIRGSMAQRTGVLNIDSVRCPYVGAGYQWEHWNAFKTATEAADASQNIAFGGDGYYKNALAEDSNTYIFYLTLAAGEEYKLFDGLNIPAEFTADQMTMFDGLKIGIYADAIQADGFNDTTDATTGDVTEEAWVKAFTALEEAHPMGWWN